MGPMLTQLLREWIGTSKWFANWQTSTATVLWSTVFWSKIIAWCISMRRGQLSKCIGDWRLILGKNQGASRFPQNCSCLQTYLGLRCLTLDSEALSASNWNRAVEGPVEIDSVWPFGIQLHKIQWIMQYGLTPKLRVRILNFIDERLASHQTPWLTINGRQWGSSSQACSNLGQIKLRCEWCDLIVSFGRILRNALLKRTTVQTKSQSVEQCY